MDYTKKKTEITFEFENGSNTSVLVKRGHKAIGRIWSQQDDGGTPYPHDKDIYCLNSVQICGFDKMSEIWGCGPFAGKKDCVVHFFPEDNEYYQKKVDEYADYVKDFFRAKTKKLDIGPEKIDVTEINVAKKLTELKSFKDWLQTGGCL